MTHRAHLLWKVLLGICAAGAVAGVACWGILLTSFCSSPRTPSPETQVDIPYNCHGMTVYISHFQDALRYWIGPVEILFIVLSVLAGAMVILGFAKVRIDVRIQVDDGTREQRG